MKKISLDKKGIYEYQQNREPYLLIDCATEIIPGQSAKGYKDLKDDEEFYEDCSRTSRENYENSLYNEKNFVQYITRIFEELI